MTDLIERLYEPCKRWKRCKETRYEAADALEAAQAEIGRLREALRDIREGVDPEAFQMIRDIADEALAATGEDK